MASQFTFGDSFLNAYIGAQQRAQQQKQYETEMAFKRQQADQAVKQFNQKFGFDVDQAKITNDRNARLDAETHKANFFDNGTPDDTSDDISWNLRNFNAGRDDAKTTFELRGRQLDLEEGRNQALNRSNELQGKLIEREIANADRIQNFYKELGHANSQPTTDTSAIIDKDYLQRLKGGKITYDPKSQEPPRFLGLSYDPESPLGWVFDKFGINSDTIDPNNKTRFMQTSPRGKELNAVYNKYPDLFMTPQGQSLLSMSLNDINATNPNFMNSDTPLASYARWQKLLLDLQTQAETAKSK